MLEKFATLTFDQWIPVIMLLLLGINLIFTPASKLINSKLPIIRFAWFLCLFSIACVLAITGSYLLAMPEVHYFDLITFVTLFTSTVMLTRAYDWMKSHREYIRKSKGKKNENIT